MKARIVEVGDIDFGSHWIDRGLVLQFKSDEDLRVVMRGQHIDAVIEFRWTPESAEKREKENAK